MIHVLDTHALTRYIEGNRQLGPEGQVVVADESSVLVLPTITLAEARFMIAKNKVSIFWGEIISAIETDTRFLVHPLTLEVLDLMPNSLEMHDGIICATAMLLRDSLGEDVAVITRDREIRESGLVDTVW